MLCFKWPIFNVDNIPFNKYWYCDGKSSAIVMKNIRMGFNNSLSVEFNWINALSSPF